MSDSQLTEAEAETLRSKIRFEQELEFVQSLANVDYLHHLAHRLYLEDPKFIAYLRYLQYWKQPEYAQFIVYPSALQILDFILKNPKEAATALKDPNFKQALHTQQYFYWQNHDREEAT